MTIHSVYCRGQCMLGLFDASEGKLILSRVQGNSVCRMEPRVHGVKYEADGTDLRKEHDSVDLLALRRERNAKLIEAFGSQRRKRQLANARAGRVDATQVAAGDAMLNLIRSTGADPGRKEDVIQRHLADRNIPPHNPSGSSADEAYPFESIVPAAIRDSIATSLLEQAVSDPSMLDDVKHTFGKYVASRIHESSSFHATDDSHSQRVVCLAFLGHLLQLLTNPKRLFIRIKTDAGGIQSAAEGLRIPTSTLEGILGLFYTRESMDDGAKYVMDKRNRNLMLSWCLTLAIRAERESILPAFAFQKLVEELKMKSAEVANIFRELGCKTKRSNQSYLVSLLHHNPGEEHVTLATSFPALKLGARK